MKSIFWLVSLVAATVGADEDVLIGGQYFTFSAEKVSWDVANERCKSMNAKLAVLVNPQAFHAYASSNYSGERFWLGGADINNEGTWTWINGQPFASFPWGPGQPDNHDGFEDCLEWGWKNNYNDEHCPNFQRYVCQEGVEQEDDVVLISGQYLTFSTEKVSWDVANERCKSKNAKLAVLVNPQAFHAYASSNYSGERFWLGGSDSDNEGTWTWINGQPIAMLPWGSGQPDDKHGNEDCLEWGWKNNFNDDRCIRESRYVCSVECPEDEGFFYQRSSNQCFKFYPDKTNSWDKVTSFCEGEGLVMAHPHDPIGLREIMVSKYGPHAEPWVNAIRVGNTNNYKWKDDNSILPSNSSLWFPGQPEEYCQGGGCVILLVWDLRLESNPDQPYYGRPCSGYGPPEWGYYTLCEYVQG